MNSRDATPATNYACSDGRRGEHDFLLEQFRKRVGSQPPDALPRRFLFRALERDGSGLRSIGLERRLRNQRERPNVAIKAILAQAQIEQGQTAALKGEPTRISIASGATKLLDVGEASDAKQSAYLASQTAEAYQGLLTQVLQWQPDSRSSGPSGGASSASATGDTNGSASEPLTATPMLLLTVRVINDPSASVDGVEAQAATQAEQIVSAFQSGTVDSASANGSGFSFIGDFGPAAMVVITGVQISLESNSLPGYSTNSTTCDMSAFQALTNQSTGHIGCAESEDMGMAFTIPIAK